MLDALISNKTRVKLLLRFFLNPESRAYLRGLGREFEESNNAIRVELNRFEDAGIIQSEREGNRKYYRANSRYPLFKEVRQIALKHLGIDQVVEHVITKLGHVEKVYLTDHLARGLDHPIIDFVIIAEQIDHEYFAMLVDKAEKVINRKIRTLILKNSELDRLPEPNVLIYNHDNEEVTPSANRRKEATRPSK